MILSEFLVLIPIFLPLPIIIATIDFLGCLGLRRLLLTRIYGIVNLVKIMIIIVIIHYYFRILCLCLLGLRFFTLLFLLLIVKVYYAIIFMGVYC